MKALFFDLCETIVCGIVGLGVFPKALRRYCGIDWLKYFPDGGLIHDEMFLDALRGYISEKAFWEKLIAQYGFEAGPKDFEFALQEALLTVYNGMPNLISELKKRGHRLFLVSDLSRESMDFVLKEHHFLGLFEQKFFSCSTGKIKADPGMFPWILEQTDVSPSEAIFIDDSVSNISRATAAGMTGIQFDDRNYKSTIKLRMMLGRKGVEVN